jgi:hypothetical protein
MRAGRIICDHAPDGGARTGRDVRPKTKAVRFEKGVELIEDNAGSYAHRAFFNVETFDFSIVARKIDDQPFADGIADQACTGPARGDGNIFVGCRPNDRARFGSSGRKRNSERLNLINRRVRRVKLPGQIIEMNVATGRADSLFRGFTDHSTGNLTQQIAPERHWQVKCYQSGAVSVTLKTKIRYNGQEYARPADLPPDVRQAYEKALHGGSVVTRKFVVNGQSFANEEAMPADVRKLCDDAMEVIENNGQVTIPDGENCDQLLTKKELGIAIAVGVGIAALVLSRIFHG